MGEDEKELRLITEKEYAKIRRCATQTLRNERSRGDGVPYYKIGRSVRYASSDIQKFIASKRVQPKGIILLRDIAKKNVK